MQRKKPDVDIVLDILKETLLHNPSSSFVSSLLHQYQERGGLSKKQLEGLYNKSLKVPAIPPNKIATLEAIIKRKHEKHRSPLPVATPLLVKDESSGPLIEAILAKYPQHKRVVFLKAKYDTNEPLSVVEKEELQKFYKIATR